MHPRTTSAREITRLLVEWREGNESALDQLLAPVYDELRRTASAYMRREHPDHILQTTALGLFVPHSSSAQPTVADATAFLCGGRAG